MPEDRSVKRGGDVDPHMRRFMEEVGAAWARHTPSGHPSPQEMREVAELVRAPWTQGGPAMARTQERHVPTTHGSVRVRVLDPSDGPPKPALIYVHGGGWTMFSLDTHDRIMREYAARAGVVVIGVDYALSPEARFPTALEQVVAVVRWAATAPDLGIDPDRLGLGGDSAGGNLSFAAALMLRDAGEVHRLKALLLNYAVLDDDSSPEYHARFGGEGHMLASEEMAMFWDGYLRGPGDRLDPLAVPLRADLSGLPPVFLTIPECDVLTGQSLEMATGLRAAGTAVTARIYEGATHSFLEAVAIAPLAARALQEGGGWLAAALETSIHRTVRPSLGQTTTGFTR